MITSDIMQLFMPIRECKLRAAALFVAGAFSCIGVNDVHAQLFQTGVDDELRYPIDTLLRRHEWWLGFGGSAFYAKNFGTLTVDIIGGTAPGSPTFPVQPSGGYSFGAGIGPVVEYRPLFSQIGFVLSTAVEWRWATAETSTPMKRDIFAYNAVFEAQSQLLYFVTAVSAKAQIGPTGAFLLAGITADIPLKTQESIVWQHELWEGEAPSNLPGAPQTSIKFNSNVDYMPRVGIQIGVGHDFMAGMFGYRGQLITPYFVIQGATPTVMEPTAWNNISARLGVMWRAGL